MVSTIIIVIAYIFLQMCVVWILYRIYNNPSIVDCSWPIGLMIVGLIYLFSTAISFRKLIIASFLVIWSLRLAVYIGLTRLRFGQVDKRYKALSSQWKMSQSLGFFINFQIQGGLILILSLIFFFISRSMIGTLFYIDFIAIVLILAGIIGESIADFQLNHFKQGHHGQVCNQGLWYYSGHPKYFFD